MRTIADPVEGEVVRLEPSDDDGITINGVAATLENVDKADVRVDLARADRRSFVVEHVLGPLGLHGITAVDVTGTVDSWSFDRPEHRFCYSVDLGPHHVVGHPAGLPNPGIHEAIESTKPVAGDPAKRVTVSEPVRFEDDAGHLTLRPADPGDGLQFDVTFGDARKRLAVDPLEGTDTDAIAEIVTSTTPFLAPDDAEAATHAIADLVSDIGVLGGFSDLVVEGELNDHYHSQTIGAARKAREVGAVAELSPGPD
ncbi:MAG: hypothetical protein V5A33_05585 [Halobacteriales archaeon]